MSLNQKNNKKWEMEKKSSAVSLSDMEIFVFPDVMFSLVLANILSPQIWKWLDEPWFADIDEQKPYKKVQRLRQYIMDNYSFNLDLDTWGLTTREKEMNRFSDFIDPKILSQSNALFGYEGDKYYFDMDIRRHFGLDKFTDETIPYWKTETVEAMTAFRFIEGHNAGAGECVSLAALWAASLFVVCKIPLEDIFMMATPLHSQNFVLLKEGILTNNRRIVTKNMWVNGTELSAKARRAIQKEKVTVVSHVSGYIHTMYDEATIDASHFDRFSTNLMDFLHNKPTAALLANFLRKESHYVTYFQVERSNNQCGVFLPLERLYVYEHSSNFSAAGPSRKKLFEEIDCEEFYVSQMPNRIRIRKIEEYFRTKHPDFRNAKVRDEMIELINNEVSGTDFKEENFSVEKFVDSFIDFCYLTPRLPEYNKKNISSYETPIEIDISMDREAIREHLLSIRDKNQMADYTFYALRDMESTDPVPFLKAAIERNPVGLKAMKDLSLREAYSKISDLPPGSIYEESFRMAQPDEVWNFGKGDGLEKAVLMANLIISRKGKEGVEISIKNNIATLKSLDKEYTFPTEKTVKGNILHFDWEV